MSVFVSEDELRLIAEADWLLAAVEALNMDMRYEVELYRPAEGADWRVIDQAIADLRREMALHKRVRRFGGVS